MLYEGVMVMYFSSVIQEELKKLEAEDVPIIPISTVTEDGIVKLKMEVSHSDSLNCFILYKKGGK